MLELVEAPRVRRPQSWSFRAACSSGWPSREHCFVRPLLLMSEPFASRRDDPRGTCKRAHRNPFVMGTKVCSSPTRYPGGVPLRPCRGDVAASRRATAIIEVVWARGPMTHAGVDFFKKSPRSARRSAATSAVTRPPLITTAYHDRTAER